MRQLALIAAVAVAWCSTAAASTERFGAAPSAISAPANTVLHVGSHGQSVKDLQWLLGGHKPNTFTAVKATFHWKPNGYFGKRTAAAVKQYKWSLGYPGRLIRPIAGRYFLRLLVGQERRPIRWVALAAARIRIVAEGPSKMALRIRALEITQLGVAEYPFGSNRGRTVESYQRVTGAVGLAWCVSFQQAMFRWSGYGTFAYDTASVYFAVDYGQSLGLLRARAKVGAIVAFIEYDHYGHRVPGTGHMGFVVRVTGSGFVYVAGNDGNAVREHWIASNARAHVFIYLRGVTS